MTDSVCVYVCVFVMGRVQIHTSCSDLLILPTSHQDRALTSVCVRVCIDIMYVLLFRWLLSAGLGHQPAITHNSILITGSFLRQTMGHTIHFDHLYFQVKYVVLFSIYIHCILNHT